MKRVDPLFHQKRVHVFPSNAIELLIETSGPKMGYQKSMFDPGHFNVRLPAKIDGSVKQLLVGCGCPKIQNTNSTWTRCIDTIDHTA